MLCDRGQNSKHLHRDVAFSRQSALKRRWRKQDLSRCFLLLCSGSATVQPLPGLERILQSNPLTMETDLRSSAHHWAPWVTTPFAGDPLPHPLTAPLSLGSHPLCKLTPLVSDHCSPQEAAEQLWPEQTSKLLCYPGGWTTPSPVRLNQPCGGEPFQVCPPLGILPQS